MLALFPSSIIFIICPYSCTTSLLRSSTYGPNDGCSLTLRLLLFFGLSKSRTFSLYISIYDTSIV